MSNKPGYLLAVMFLSGLLTACGGTAATATTIPSPTGQPTATKPPAATLAIADTPTDAPNACKLPEAAHRGDVGLGFPRYPSRMKSVGIVKARVLFVDFPDRPAQQSPEEVLSLVSPGAIEFYQAVSYGKLDLQLEPHFTWLRMSLPSTAYAHAFESYDAHLTYLQEAIDLADLEVDFASADAVYVFANPDVTALTFGPAFSGAPQFGGARADSRDIYNGATSGNDLTYWGYGWLNHEVGHTMGLVDLYAFEGDADRFVGDFSLMGVISGKAPEYFAYERWLLGWLDDDQIACQQSNSETVTLTAIEIAGGTKAVMVPTGPTSAVVVESRRAVGYDSGLPESGALVYTVDTSVLSGEGPIRVFPDNDPQRYTAPLAVGESVTVDGVTVKVVDATADSDTVEVTLAP